MTDHTYHCSRLSGTIRCQFSGDNEAAGEHWRETGHPRCIVCSDFLDNGEPLTCQRCVTKVRTCLTEIVECVAMAPSVIEAAAYRGTLPIDLLAMITDGTIESAVQSQHPELYRDVEWRNDPIPVIAALYGLERAWREEFGHGPRMTDATVTSCTNYLIEWLPLAARTWLGFDDDAAEIKQLANRLRHAVGVADDPVKGTACLDCGTTLVRPYRMPGRLPSERFKDALPRIVRQRDVEVTYAPDHVSALTPWPDEEKKRDFVARAHAGLEVEGKDDIWHCRSCKRDYAVAEYHLAQRQRVVEAQGWVKVRLASEVSGRHVSIIWRWINSGRVEVERDADNHVVVWFPDVMAVSNDPATRRRANDASGSACA